MKEMVQELVSFAKSWGIELVAEYDVDWAGECVHRVVMSDEQGVEGGGNNVFFWVRCEQEGLCFYGAAKTAEELAEYYKVEFEKLDWDDVPEGKTAMCWKLSRIDLNDVVQKRLLQYILKARADDFGREMSMGLSGSSGGCAP